MPPRKHVEMLLQKANRGGSAPRAAAQIATRSPWAEPDDGTLHPDVGEK